MQNIQINIEAFGAIERHLPRDLILHCVESSCITDVLLQLEQLYPDTKQMLERCACAIGEDIVPRQTLLNHDTTLVMLSPVAGG